MAYVPFRAPVTGRYEVRPGQAPRTRKVKDPSPPLSTDGRRRYNRRRKAIEAALRTEVARQGRVVDLLMDHRIGAAAEAAIQCEIIRAKRSMGEGVHDEI